MLTVRLPVLFKILLLALSFLAGVQAAPKRKTGNTATARKTPQQQAAALPQGISQATDGSTILDTTVTVNGAQLRFKISGPADQFTAASNVTGATQQAGAQGALGLNVLLHGDGGQSFFDFPNQAVQGGLMGVVILAPSEQLLWGQRTGNPSGLSRADGVADAQAVNDLIQQVLPQIVAFNTSNVFFTGVSGGSLTLSGFFVPAHLANFAGNGVLLMCGALVPQVPVVNASAFAANTKIHFQSTQDELALLQPAIPAAIVAYETLATDAGLSKQEIGLLQTVDNTPPGGHCEFDGVGFSSGIQLIADNFENIMQGGDGAVDGINAKTVLTSVVGNENLQFAA
ncbi:hypothetical protein B0T22DRAFT_74553 [Podospora appendiculata]|uniref:Cyclin-like f-box protein n=1 Tax=Podospora appendiculata TaxID=314037 RepID=A0AAE0XJI1_9PEZI|nr:hypothetical protein B0T22DRAFT_74553 [Podospora appendiculata]